MHPNPSDADERTHHRQAGGPSRRSAGGSASGMPQLGPQFLLDNSHVEGRPGEWPACAVEKPDTGTRLDKQQLTLAGDEDLIRPCAAGDRHDQEVAGRAVALDHHISAQVWPLLDESDAITGLRERPVGRRRRIDRRRK
jgi:hypothetical protein